MRICTQCGHKLSAEEYLCPVCDLWDSRSYTEPKKTRRSLLMATVFVGPFQHALLVRQLCEGAGIPAVIDSARGNAVKGVTLARVQVPHDRAGDAAEILSRGTAVDVADDEPAADPGLRRQRRHLRARLSLRRRAYQALAWAILALVFPPAGLVSARLATLVLAENRGLPVVTEETRVARASLAISAVALLVFAAVIAAVLHGVQAAR